MSDFVKTNYASLSAFRDMSHAVGSRVDYVQGGGGNTSVKLPDGSMAIKASGFCLSDIENDAAYSVLNYKDIVSFYLEHEPQDFPDVEAAGAAQVKSSIMTIDALSQLRPSVEAGIHDLLPAYVIHSHSVYANLAACAKEGLDIVKEAFKNAPYTVGFVPYTDPGARLSVIIRDEIRRVTLETGKAPSVIIMQNHGIIAAADTAGAAQLIHADANGRHAAAFGISDGSFVDPKIKKVGEGLFASDTDYLTNLFKSGKYDEKFLLEEPLYPDQLVFLTGTFSFGGEPAADCCTLQAETGKVLYRMSEKKARVIEETLCAVLFICEHIRAKGYTLSTMGESAKAFIANWESEKYRKSLAGKSK